MNRYILLVLLLCVSCGGMDTSDRIVPIGDFTVAEAAAIGRPCEDITGDGFCDVELGVTVIWPEGWE
jgi:hypothetical protein